MELPIKCPVAPLEFTFLADWWLPRAGPARQGRDRLRHPAERGASPSRSAARHLGGHPREQGHQGRDRLLRRARRRRPQGPRLLRRRETALRPAGHRPGEHGRRGDRPLRAGRRAEPRAGRTSTPSSPASTPTSSPSATRRPAHLEGRLGGALPVEVLRRELPALRRGPGDAGARSTATPTASSSRASARACSSTSTTTPSRCPGKLPPARHRPLLPAAGDASPTTGAR